MRDEDAHPHTPAPRVTGPSDGLPAADLPFVDRSDERSLLGAAADPDGVAVVHVSGLRGIGKTALALYAAHHDLPGFAGRRVQLSLAGTPSLGDTLSALLIGLGVDAAMIPSLFEERRQLYLRVTGAAGPILLVLDDVETAAQVKTLLPAAPGSVVIANSENRLGELVMSGGRLLSLRPLAPSASVELLTRMLGPYDIAAEPADLETLAELCGHLPLALRIAAKLLIIDGYAEAGALAAALRDDQAIDLLSAGPETTMRHLLDAVYDRLPGEVAAAYRALAAHPGPDFTAEAAAAAMSLPLPEARERLRALRDVNLVQAGPGGRYAFPALVAVHARRRAAELDPEPTRQARLDRIVAWYAAGAVHADRAGLAASRLREAYEVLRSRYPAQAARLAGTGRTFAGPAEAMRWEHDERINVLAAIRAVQDAEAETAIFALVLCEAMWPLFQTWKYHADWIEADELGARIAGRLGLASVEAGLTNQLARAHLDLGEPDRAERTLDAARTVAGRLPGPAPYLAETAGLIARARGDWDAAVAALREACAGNAELGDARGEALQLYQLAATLTQAGRPEEAAGTLATARERLAGTDDPYLSGRIDLELGRAYRDLGRPGEAAAALARAAEVMRERAQPAKELAALELLSEVAPGDAYAARAAELRAHAGLP